MSLRGNLVPQTRMRKAIARRMSDSKRDAPHFYVSTEIEMDAVSALVADESERAGSRITATAALVRACVVALRENPRVNSVWTDEGLLQSEEINPGVAIALEEGLIAPALLAADRLDLQATAAALGDLATRTRNGEAQRRGGQRRNVHAEQPRHVRRLRVHRHRDAASDRHLGDGPEHPACRTRRNADRVSRPS